MIAFSMISTFQVQLPAGNNKIVIYIRDLLDSIIEVNISSIYVIVNSEDIDNLINSLQGSSSQINNNQFVRLLSSGNQNVVGQILTSLSQEFNNLNTENIDNTVLGGIPAASISISALGSGSLQQVILFNQSNESAMSEYEKDLNSQANARDYLMTYVTNLPITTSNSIKLQSSSLAQLTQSTNQLTRNAATLAIDKCYQLSLALYSIATQISYEDAQIASTQLTQCASNVLTVRYNLYTNKNYSKNKFIGN